MVSCAPGANAITTSAARNGRKFTTMSTNAADTAIATAAEPSPAQKYSIGIGTVVLEKRQPTSPPSSTTAELPSHQGNVTCTQSPPCSTAEAIIAPNRSPPGNLIQCMRIALAVDAATRIASSASE